LGARSVLVLCVLWGAILLVCADMVARTIAYPIELPVGVFTTLLGAPFFAWQLVRRLRGRV
jgi:iron complex transport system permease protein